MSSDRPKARIVILLFHLKSLVTYQPTKRYLFSNCPLDRMYLFTSLLSHNFIPSSMIKSVIVPIVKDRSGYIFAKSNYRPIGLSSTASKIFEIISLKRSQDKLYTTPNPFDRIVYFSSERNIEFYASAWIYIFHCFY